MTEAALNLLDRTFRISDQEAEELMLYCKNNYLKDWEFVQFLIDNQQNTLALAWLRKQPDTKLVRLADVYEKLFEMKGDKEVEKQRNPMVEMNNFHGSAMQNFQPNSRALTINT